MGNIDENLNFMKKLKPIRIRTVLQPMLTYSYANTHKDSKPTMLTPNYCKAQFKLFPVIPTMYFPRLLFIQ